ncbi:MAG: flagellar biosynthesis protein FlhB [Pseudooceanicola sp.]|nr:flagellar biosynthesis protein FlhB [Pseudooceanicola sp.]
MSGEDAGDKSFEPTPQKLQKAREKGEVARSTDLSVAASYLGLVLAILAAGPTVMAQLGQTLSVMLDQPDRLAALVFDGPAETPLGGFGMRLAVTLAPWFALPAAAVLGAILAQRALVFAPTKLAPKLSRISLIANAKNKFGRNGLFEFAKSFVKLILYSVCLGLFLDARLERIVGAMRIGDRAAIVLLGEMVVAFLFIALVIAAALGAIDTVWQHAEFRRRNMMSRKEVMDETKDSEGDPHMKQQRRYRGQKIALSRMLADVPAADVVIVNPTHYAVALKWSRKKGSAPVCVAKGVDEMAATIRQVAQEAGVPVHSDPPTARAIHASVEIGREIDEQLYAPVAAAIRFAEAMRRRAKGRGA